MEQEELGVQNQQVQENAVQDQQKVDVQEHKEAEKKESKDPVLDLLKADMKEEDSEKPKDHNLVPKSALLKNIAQKKEYRRENEELKKQLAEVNTKLETVLSLKGQDRTVEDDFGIDETDDKKVQSLKPEDIDALVEKKLAEKEHMRARERYEAGLEEKFKQLAPIVQKRIDYYKKTNPEFVHIFEDESFTESFAKIPLECTNKIAESPYSPQLFTVLMGNRPLLDGLANRDINSTIEFGRLLGKLSAIQSKDPKPINPLPTTKVDLTSKYDPDDPKSASEIHRLAEQNLRSG